MKESTYRDYLRKPVGYFLNDINQFENILKDREQGLMTDKEYQEEFKTLDRIRDVLYNHLDNTSLLFSAYSKFIDILEYWGELDEGYNKEYDCDYVYSDYRDDEWI